MTTTVHVLRQTNMEERPHEAVTISIHSNRELALKAFDRMIESWNTDVDPTDEYWIHPEVARDELALDNFFEAFGGSVIWDLTTYDLDSGETM